jgi:hypothetical protein
MAAVGVATGKSVPKRSLPSTLYSRASTSPLYSCHGLWKRADRSAKTFGFFRISMTVSPIQGCPRCATMIGRSGNARATGSSSTGLAVSSEADAG